MAEAVVTQPQTMPIVQTLIASKSSRRRASLRAVLTAMPNISVVDAVDDETQMIDRIAVLSPDLVLLDDDILNEQSTPMVREIKSQFPLIRCIGVAGSKDVERAVATAGADAVLTKGFRTELLFEEIAKLFPGIGYSAAGSTMKRTILLVDDNQSYLYMTRKIIELRMPNYVVYTVEDGFAALKALEQQHFDVVAVDYNMPGMDGYELLKTIRETYPEMRAIVVTGSLIAGLKAAMHNINVQHYFSKPVDIDAFCDILADVSIVSCEPDAPVTSMPSNNGRWSS